MHNAKYVLYIVTCSRHIETSPPKTRPLDGLANFAQQAQLPTRSRWMMQCTDPYTVIFGCGNTLLGDDGFGPAVIDALDCTMHLPNNIITIDAGTGIREHLLDFLLSPVSRPARVIVIDAMDTPGLPPGTLQERDPSTIPAKKIHDFSLHQFPTVNLLRELASETTTRVTLLTAQIATIPNAVRPGLSPAVAAAVPAACKHLYRLIPELQDNAGGEA